MCNIECITEKWNTPLFSLSPGVCRRLFNLPSDSGGDLRSPCRQADCWQENRINNCLLKSETSNNNNRFVPLVLPSFYNAANLILWETAVRVPYLNAFHNYIYFLKQVGFFLSLHISEILWIACYCVHQRDFLECIMLLPTCVCVRERIETHSWDIAIFSKVLIYFV